MRMTEWSRKAEYVLEKHLYDKHSAAMVRGHLTGQVFDKNPKLEELGQVGLGNTDIEMYLVSKFSSLSNI